jgi:hypothetical protein
VNEKNIRSIVHDMNKKVNHARQNEQRVLLVRIAFQEMEANRVSA